MKSPLFLPLLITGITLILLCLSLTVAHFHPIQNPLAEDERIFWRTVFYMLAILMLPLTNLLRYILFRLNQTMPLLQKDNIEQVIKVRYTFTISIVMLMMLCMGSLGAGMFYWGDGFNSLHILTGVAGLGVFLYRPKQDEYQQLYDIFTKTKND